jgi:integral membrane sensor domain MASE1
VTDFSAFCKYALFIALIAAFYAISGMAGQLIAGDANGVSLLWPPTGIAVAALVVWGLRLWPGIAIGAIAVNLWVGTPLHIASGIALGNTLGPLLIATLLQRYHFVCGFPARRHVWIFLLLSILGMLIPATNGMLWLSLSRTPNVTANRDRCADPGAADQRGSEQTNAEQGGTKSP